MISALRCQLLDGFLQITPMVGRKHEARTFFILTHKLVLDRLTSCWRKVRSVHTFLRETVLDPDKRKRADPNKLHSYVLTPAEAEGLAISICAKHHRSVALPLRAQQVVALSEKLLQTSM
jgi:hypothetical protein